MKAPSREHSGTIPKDWAPTGTGLCGVTFWHDPPARAFDAASQKFRKEIAAAFKGTWALKFLDGLLGSSQMKTTLGYYEELARSKREAASGSFDAVLVEVDLVAHGLRDGRSWKADIREDADDAEVKEAGKHLTSGPGAKVLAIKKETAEVPG